MTPNLFLSFFLLVPLCLATPTSCQHGTCEGVSSEILLQKRAYRDTATESYAEHGERRSSVRIVRRHSGQAQNRPGVPDTVNKSEVKSECAKFYNTFLKGKAGLHQISHIWMDLCQTEEMRVKWKEVKDGCLYLPTDKHMEHLRDCVDRPNPWHYVYFLEDLFFKVAAEEKCPSAPGSGKSTAEGGETFKSCEKEEGFEGEDGDCVEATEVEVYKDSNLRVFTLDGLMGLDQAWADMISKMCSPERVPLTSLLSRGNGSKLDLSVDHSVDKTVTIPMKFVVCDGGTGELNTKTVTDHMIQLQLANTNRAFAGKDKCTTSNAQAVDGLGASFEAYHVQHADMRIQFTHHSTHRVTHALCRDDCTKDWAGVVKHVAPRENGMIKAVICKTQVLGLASAPCGWDGLIFLNYQTLPTGKMYNYNEGHTLTHEAGHYFGLMHTFDRGCAGDNIADTNPEEAPNNGCPASQQGLKKTCDKSGDPVHNFMDYSFDRCMCSFTQGQKVKAWATMQQCMPDIFAMVKPQPATWSVSGTGCVMVGDCIQTINFPRNYHVKTKCTINIKGTMPITTSHFHTEYIYDHLTVNNRRYSGTYSPGNKDATGAIYWNSDYSVTKNPGWKICKRK